MSYNPFAATRLRGLEATRLRGYGATLGYAATGLRGSVGLHRDAGVLAYGKGCPRDYVCVFL